VARLPAKLTGRPPTRHNPGPNISGETPLTSPGESPQVNLPLTVPEAEALHATLEKLLEGGLEDPLIERSYRALGWRILASKGGTGLTARIAEIAREATSLEEYESERDRALGPILEGLEHGENRDP
jgi:hypothetical protein